MSARATRRLAVASAPLLLLAGLPSGAPAASHPSAARVQVMVVSEGGAVMVPPRTVLAAAARVTVAGRSCAVAPSTPLAVLAALHHAGGPPFALRDYGHCGASPASSSELFVTAVGGQRNSGQNGWEYKVNGLAGSTGAADPSGPAGNGRRLPGGSEVLWFYCRMGPRGCQRTLKAVPQSTAVAAGAPLPVTVTGYDDEGKPAPVAGATVMLGSSSATSLNGGAAILTAPSTPGSYELSVTDPGLVPSFPVAVRVQ